MKIPPAKIGTDRILPMEKANGNGMQDMPLRPALSCPSRTSESRTAPKGKLQVAQRPKLLGFRISLLTLRIAFILLLAVPAGLSAQQHEDFDEYKLRLEGFWFHSNPSGSVQGSADSGLVDLQKDLAFDSYSTFAGKIDWKFTRKNHLYIVASPFDTSRQTTLNRTFVFQGQTFEAGLIVQSDLHAVLIAPGYQYDLIRRKRGHLGIAVQIDFFDTSATISASAQIVNGTQQAAVSANGSLLAPIPVAGPEFRLYLTNSPRFFVEGNVYGMYLAGYGNFVSTSGTLGLTLTKHLSINAGYQLGSRLVVENDSSSDRIGLRLTQRVQSPDWSFLFDA
jgi:hypothetical protein